MDLNELVKERIKENQKLFSKKELQIIKNNVKIVKEIYFIGLIDGRQIWKNM